MLAAVASTISNANTNIESISTQVPNSGQVEFILSLQVKGRDQLADVIKKLKKLKNTLSINRIHDQEMREAKILH